MIRRINEQTEERRSLHSPLLKSVRMSDPAHTESFLGGSGHNRTSAFIYNLRGIVYVICPYLSSYRKAWPQDWRCILLAHGLFQGVA